jgi:hypothetical protein
MLVNVLLDTEKVERVADFLDSLSKDKAHEVADYLRELSSINKQDESCCESCKGTGYTSRTIADPYMNYEKEPIARMLHWVGPASLKCFDSVARTFSEYGLSETEKTNSCWREGELLFRKKDRTKIETKTVRFDYTLYIKGAEPVTRNGLRVSNLNKVDNLIGGYVHGLTTKPVFVSWSLDGLYYGTNRLSVLDLMLEVKDEISG